MQSPLVSVIVSAYQQPAFLNEALASVAAQTYENLEILVVDDASGDVFTAQYMLSAKARLLIHRERRAAAAASRNTGLAEARGKYVAFLDQDDVWMPEKIAVQVEAMEKQSAALMHFVHFRNVDERLNALQRQDEPVVLSDPVQQMVLRNFIGRPAQVMMRREAFATLGLFDENIRGASDWDMWLRAAAAGPMLADKRVLALYRQHPHQWSRNGVMLAKACVAVLEKAQGWLVEKEPRLRFLLRRRKARWLRELGRVRMEQGDERELAFAALWRAVRTWPLSFRAMAMIPRAALAARAIEEA